MNEKIKWAELIEIKTSVLKDSLRKFDVFEKIKDILQLTNVPNEQLRTKREKIPWDLFFLLEAVNWCRRSHDPDTRCGCVLTKHCRIISAGYNGFISEIDDEALPNTRPYKYPFMIHAEHNAILNCARFGIKTIGSTAYVSGEPCNSCLQYMWQAAISRIVYTDFSKPLTCKQVDHLQARKALLLLMDGRMQIDFISWTDLLDKVGE